MEEIQETDTIAEAVGSIIGGTEIQNGNSGLLLFSAHYGRPEGAAKRFLPPVFFRRVFAR
jgi:hypothetical protein